MLNDLRAKGVAQHIAALQLGHGLGQGGRDPGQVGGLVNMPLFTGVPPWRSLFIKSRLSVGLKPDSPVKALRLLPPILTSFRTCKLLLMMILWSLSSGAYCLHWKLRLSPI
jgi:hypothetical protein